MAETTGRQGKGVNRPTKRVRVGLKKERPMPKQDLAQGGSKI